MIEESTLFEFEVVVRNVLLGVNFAVGNPLALPEAPTRLWDERVVVDAGLRGLDLAMFPVGKLAKSDPTSNTLVLTSAVPVAHHRRDLVKAEYL